MRGIDARAMQGGVTGKTMRGEGRRLDGVGALALLGLVLLGPGCDIKDLRTFEPNGLGNPCTIEGAAEASPTVTLVAVDVMSCASTVCLRPAVQSSTNTGALCTQGCESDVDCENAQLRDSADPNDVRCAGGFSCQMPIPNLPGVALSCQKVCVCRDFLSNPAAHPKAAGCP